MKQNCDKKYVTPAGLLKKRAYEAPALCPVDSWCECPILTGSKMGSAKPKVKDFESVQDSGTGYNYFNETFE